MWLAHRLLIYERQAYFDSDQNQESSASARCGQWAPGFHGILRRRSTMYRTPLVPAALLAIATLGMALAGAKDQPQTSKSNSASEKSAAPAGAGTKLDESTFPAAFDKLQLSEEQRRQVRQVQDKYNAELDGVWKQFTGRYLETISLESTLLAAIEDGLTDVQRAHVRKQRAHTAHSERQNARRDVKEALDNRKPQSDDKQTDPVDEELIVVGITLTPEQERAADKIQAGYFHRLRDLQRDIHRLHMRLLSLESDKLVEIEKILKKEQLSQLRQERQIPPAGAQSAESENGSTLKK
jgi:hypothetical protein